MIKNKKQYVNIDLFKNGPVVIFIWKNEECWPVESVSENVKNIFGYDINEFISGKVNYLNLIHSDDLSNVCLEVIENSEQNISDTFIHKPYRIIAKNGNYHWVRDITTIIRNNNEITHFIGYLIDITDEMNLKKENERSRLALQSINDGLWDWNLETNKVYFSPTLKRMLGYDDNDFENNIEEWEKRIHPEDKDQTFKDLNDHLYGRTQRYENEHRILCKDGSYKWILDRGDIVEFTINKKPKRIIGTHSDISERKKYELELIQSEAKFAQMFKTHSSMMMLVNPENAKIIDANNSAAKFYGYSIEELKSMTLYQISNKSNDLVDKINKKSLSQKNNYYQTKHILKNNLVKDIEIHASPIDTIDGVFLFCIVHDITIRKKLKKEIIKERNFVSTIIDSAKSIICVVNNKAEMIKFNKYAENFTGFTQNEIGSKPYYWLNLFPKEERVNAKIIYNRIKNDLTNKNRIVSPWKSKTKEIRFFEWSISVSLNEDNEMAYMVCVGIDITQQEENKKILKRQKEEFETIFNNAKDGIAIVNLNGNFLEFNTEFINILGYSRSELLEKSTFDLTIEAELKDAKNTILEVIEKGYKRNYKRSYINKNGEIVYLNVSSSLMPDKKRILITTKDITKDKIFEQQNKLASMGEMIGNIAHQWRQPLSIISAVSSNIKLFEQMGQNTTSQELIKNMETISEQVQYLSKTIDDFRNFIKDSNKKELINLNEIVEKTLQIIKPTLMNNNIKIISQLQSDIKIEAFTNELIQSLINIINNSKDAINHNISNSNNKFIFINTKKINDNLLLEIKDNGGGIKDELIDKIFEPYFTTKHQSIGTGIGLSMSYKILTEHHNCEIEVLNQEFEYNNQKQKGLSFRVLFTP